MVRYEGSGRKARECKEELRERMAREEVERVSEGEADR